MTDRPILFSAPMVRAMLEGRKTQTRRLAWRAAQSFVGDGPAHQGYKVEYSNIGSTPIPMQCAPTIWQKVKPGDRGYVRETWKPHSLYAHMKPHVIPQTNVFYAADNAYAPSNARWVPCIHMPRWASRLTVVMTAVTIQPLHDITEEGALAEGIVRRDENGFHVPGVEHPNKDFPYLSRVTAREMYAALWDCLHGSGAWLRNPDVVALTFTVHQCNIDAVAEAA